MPDELAHDLPVGRALDWTPRPAPDGRALEGRWCRVVPLGEEHLADLYAELNGPDSEGDWTYLSTPGPYARPEDFAAMCRASTTEPQRLSMVVLDVAGRAVGMVSYLRIQPAHGSVEVGAILHGPSLQRTTAATEAMHLLMRHAFDDLGYRRYEWKCDSLNARSRDAALRLGFTYEGTWRNAMVTKGRSRDTAWFSVTDAEWALVRAAFEAWLAPENQTEAGQARSLAEVRRTLSHAEG